MEKQKYITRYEAEEGNSYTFRGWRLCVTRQGERFVRYFSDLKCGGPEKALSRALEMRDELLAELDRKEGQAESVFREFRRRPCGGNLCQPEEEKEGNSLDLSGESGKLRGQL